MLGTCGRTAVGNNGGDEELAPRPLSELAGCVPDPSRLPLLLPVLEADKYDRRPVPDSCRWQAGAVLRKLPPALTLGGLRARIVAEVYPDESPENAPRRQRARGQKAPLDGRDEDKSTRAAVREALQRAD